MKLFNKRETFGLPITDFKNYYAEFVPALLERYNLFRPSFLERVAAEFLKTGKCAKFTNEDLRENVTNQQAALALNHCMLIASARYNHSTDIKNAKISEARSVSIEVERPCKSCAKVPKNKTYKVGKVPLYPCFDCDQDDICIFWYKINF